MRLSCCCHDFSPFIVCVLFCEELQERELDQVSLHVLGVLEVIIWNAAKLQQVEFSNRCFELFRCVPDRMLQVQKISNHSQKVHNLPSHLAITHSKRPM